MWVDALPISHQWHTAPKPALINYSYILKRIGPKAIRRRIRAHGA